MGLGSDHTVVFSSNPKDVIVFGKGGEGQLGLKQKCFLSAPTKSSALSSNRFEIGAVCAIEHCSLSLNRDGQVLTKVR